MGVVRWGSQLILYLSSACQKEGTHDGVVSGLNVWYGVYEGAYVRVSFKLEAMKGDRQFLS